MELNKLKTLIADKNDRLERQALNTAADIIEQISSQQSVIARAQCRIGELREQLTSLEVEQLDSAAILGSGE